MKRRLFFWLKILLIIYAAGGIALYYFQDYIFFRPVQLDKRYEFEFDYPFREVNIPYNAESNINIIQFTSDSLPKGVVLYFHGNRRNIEWYARFSEVFTRNGYEVWMMDYPGYGKSTGERTEKKLYEWSLLFYKLARANYSPDSIILYGKSLGSGLAAQLASVRDCKNLILETPYYNFTSLVRQYVPFYPLNRIIKYKFPTNEYLPNVTAPITIFHGTKDRLIWYSNASKLKPLLKPGDEFITLEGGGHRGLPRYSAYQLKMDSLLSGIK